MRLCSGFVLLRQPDNLSVDQIRAQTGIIGEFARVMDFKQKMSDMLNAYRPALLDQYKQRYVAWWNGNDFIPSITPLGVKSELAAHHTQAPHHHGPNHGARARVCEAIWGDGCVSPGPVEFIREVTAWLGLGPKMSMLDLGAGLGGPARAINEAYGIWIAGYEAEAEFAKEGMTRKAPISVFNPETVDLPKRKFDAVFSKDILYTVENKMRLLNQISKSLKPNGQFLIIDYVITEEANQSPQISAWHQIEGQHSNFWSRKHYASGFKEAHLELRVTEDLTATYMEFVTGGFRGLSKRIDTLIQQEPDPAMQTDLRRALALESQRWAIRAEAIQAGHVTPTRFNGFNLAKSKIR